MFIEVYYKAIRINKQFVQIPKLDCVPFEERVKQREEIVNKVVADFLANVLDDSQVNSPHINVVLVFESKMNANVFDDVPTEETPAVKALPKPFKKKVKSKDEPRIVEPEVEPVKFVRHKGAYSNPSYQF